MPEGKSPLQQGALRHEHLGCGVAGRAPGRLSPLAPVGTLVVAAHGYAEERMVPPDPPCRRQRSRSRPEPGRATMRHGEGEEGAERVRLAASGRWGRRSPIPISTRKPAVRRPGAPPPRSSPGKRRTAGSCRSRSTCSAAFPTGPLRPPGVGLPAGRDKSPEEHAQEARVGRRLGSGSSGWRVRVRPPICFLTPEKLVTDLLPHAILRLDPQVVDLDRRSQFLSESSA